MEKVEVSGEPTITSKYKIEVTKNTKGFNYLVSVRGDEIELLKEDMLSLQGWAEDTYSNK